MDRAELKSYLLDRRPNLSKGSLNTYTSILFNTYSQLHQGHNAKTDKIDIDFFYNNYKDILQHVLKFDDPQRRKTTLSACVVMTDDNPDVSTHYRSPMMQDMQIVKDNNLQQKMTEKQKENWITQDVVREKYESLYNEVTQYFKDKTLDRSAFNRFQDLVLLALTSGIFIPPRRSTDWSEMMLKGYDKKTSNYILSKKFYFNQYKTAKKMGLEVIDIPPELHALLKKYMSYLPASQQYLFVNNKGNKITPPVITKRLNDIFEKSVSVNLLRHSFLTEAYKNVPELQKMKELARQMGQTSLVQALEYVKHA